MRSAWNQRRAGTNRAFLMHPGAVTFLARQLAARAVLFAGVQEARANAGRIFAGDYVVFSSQHEDHQGGVQLW
eukprot:9325678-Lingulodinium_polyedra.AAC.1